MVIKGAEIHLEEALASVAVMPHIGLTCGGNCKSPRRRENTNPGLVDEHIQPDNSQRSGTSEHKYDQSQTY